MQNNHAQRRGGEVISQGQDGCLVLCRESPPIDKAMDTMTQPRQEADGRLDGWVLGAGEGGCAQTVCSLCRRDLRFRGIWLAREKAREGDRGGGCRARKVRQRTLCISCAMG